MMKKTHLILCASLPLLLNACALNAPPEKVSVTPQPQWYAPLPKAPVVDDKAASLPHHGTLTDLSQWWQQQNDPLLVELIQAAQTVSPTVATAVARIEQSRASRVAAEAALIPKLDASVTSTRTNTQAPLPLGTTTQAALQPSWEADIFGGNRATSRAALSRLQGAQANWHDARVSVAAEVANRYYSLRTCNKLAIVTEEDATSRAETSRLSDLVSKAGFQAPATAALARASAAEGRGRATQQTALCDLDVKALVALTAIDEPTLRKKISDEPAPDTSATVLDISSLPAQTLTQRPDVFIAEREVAAASAEVGSAQAQRYPKLSLSGSIGVASFRSGGVTTNLDTWSVGPVSLSLPLFDGGTRKANVTAAEAQYETAVIAYRSSVRQAVREVEEALVNLQSTAARSETARVSVEGYRASFNGFEALYKNGLANLVDLEEARRLRLASELNAVALERERMSAWIALYRAAGGGWVNPDTVVDPNANATPPTSTSTSQ